MLPTRHALTNVSGLNVLDGLAYEEAVRSSQDLGVKRVKSLENLKTHLAVDKKLTLGLDLPCLP